MFARLFPSEGKVFFDYFEQHAAKTLEAAKLLHAMLANPSDIPGQARRIKEVEHEGDGITHRAVETLHKTFVTPFDRGDIHRLITRLDDILDLIDATSERVWLYGITAIDREAVQLAEVLVQAVTQVTRAMAGLRNLKDRDALLQICMEINRYENEGDTLLRSALARLFSGDGDPVMLIKWKDIFDFLEDAIDRCEDVANVLEGVALEYT
jgi:predicted phosphate transport protein (TIGR00153 family)